MRLYNTVTGQYFEATDYTTRGFLEGKRSHLRIDKDSVKSDHQEGMFEEEEWFDDETMGSIKINPEDSPLKVAESIGKMFEDIGIDYKSENVYGAVRITYQKEL